MKYAIPLLWMSLYGLPAAAADLPGGGISAEHLSRHVQVLASDAFEGRAPATPGEEKTVAYLIDALKTAGVQPGGDNGGWTQAVPLVRAQVQGPVQATLPGGGKARSPVDGGGRAGAGAGDPPRISNVPAGGWLAAGGCAGA